MPNNGNKGDDIINLMNQRGLSTVFIVICVVLVAFGYLLYKNIPQKETEKTPPSTQQPTPKGIRPDNFNLASVWQESLSTYTNPQFSLSFKYPAIFTTTVNDTSSYPANVTRPSFSLTINTPDTPQEKKQKAGFDLNSYNKNTMRIRVYQYDNDSNKTLDNFLADIYSGPGIDGKTPAIVTLKKNLIFSNTPKAGSYLYIGTPGEIPTKMYFFANRDKVYNFSLSGGNNTGDSYSKEAEEIFDKVISSIKFSD